MAKIKLTKNELKKQKDSLKRFDQYLPTLLLKKQQLQAEVLKINAEIKKLKQEKEDIEKKVYEWVDVFAERPDIKEKISIENIITVTGNIAGIDIPVYEKMDFREEKYDLVREPLWFDEGIRAARKVIEANARIKIAEKQRALIREELRVTTQRVNLFEKIMIPRTRGNIKKIRIYLGDMQTAAVVTGKIAKDKILEKEN